jgi:hypothetical protein
MAAMSGRWLCASAVGALALVLAHLQPAVAESTPMVATTDTLAVVTATAAPSIAPRPADQSPRLIVKVTGYQPPPNGAVQAVVKVQGDGTGPDRVIGRFGVFPTTGFTSADPSRAQTYGLPLPKDLANRNAVKLSVQLEPIRGSGEGASLEVGSAEIQ